MYINLDIEKSLRTKKICLKDPYVSNFSNIVFDFMTILLVFGIQIYAIYYEISHINDDNKDTLGTFFSIFLPFCFCVLAVFYMADRRKLTKLPILSKKDILEATNQLNWKIEHLDTNFIIIIPKISVQINILFDQYDVYIYTLKEGLRGTWGKNQSIQYVFLKKIEEIKKHDV
jgi:hypothetical protein